jgi:hypothetical protein
MRVTDGTGFGDPSRRPVPEAEADGRGGEAIDPERASRENSIAAVPDRVLIRPRLPGMILSHDFNK